MNKQEFISELKNLNIYPTEEQLQKLEIYKNFLQEQNKLYNLTSIITDEEIYLKHFYDSLTIVKSKKLEKANNLLDIGTGAGFPGVIIKIFYPEISIYLLDSNNKKIKFLNLLIEKLSLKKIYTIHERCEIFAHSNFEKFDIVTSRAVTSLDNLLELSLPMVKIGGYFIALKGNVEEELSENLKTINFLNSKILEVINFNLPKENSTRNIVIIKKNKKISSRYPRTFDKIKKNPLKKIVN